MINYNEFYKIVKKEEIQDLINNYKKKEIPFGTYEVKINNITFKKSKNNRDMLCIIFNIINGEYINNTIILNQVMGEKFQNNIVDDILRFLSRSIKIETYSFKGYSELTEYINNNVSNVKYNINYSKSNNGFTKIFFNSYTMEVGL